jgi:hypothetical protein
MAGAQQSSAAADEANPTLGDLSVHVREPGGEQLQAALLLPAFGAAGIAAGPPSPAPHRCGQPRPEIPDRPPQAGPFVQQVAVAPLPLILAGAGDRPRPSAGAGPVSKRFLRVLWPSPWPSRQRSPRSWPASRPRYSPTSRSTAWSATESRSRLRMRAPIGGATTNGVAMARSRPGIEATRSCGCRGPVGDSIIVEHTFMAEVAVHTPTASHRRDGGTLRTFDLHLDVPVRPPPRPSTRSPASCWRHHCWRGGGRLQAPWQQREPAQRLEVRRQPGRVLLRPVRSGGQQPPGLLEVAGERVLAAWAWCPPEAPSA